MAPSSGLGQSTGAVEGTEAKAHSMMDLIREAKASRSLRKSKTQAPPEKAKDRFLAPKKQRQISRSEKGQMGAKAHLPFVSREAVVV